MEIIRYLSHSFFSYALAVGHTTDIGFSYDNGTLSDSKDNVIECMYAPSTDYGYGRSTDFMVV
ncbi:MAG: hypothetical protein ACI9QN_002029 [Arcticibacterium sp.]